MKNYIIVLFITSFLFTACGDDVKQTSVKSLSVKRFGSVTGQKAEKLDYYKKLHANAWPSVLKKIKECNIRNYSIYLQKIGDDYYLVGSFQDVGAGFDAGMKKV